MASPRRISVSSRPGVYYRPVGRHRHYEVTYRDTTGRQRWERVPGQDNLDDAEALRDERRGQKRRGDARQPPVIPFTKRASMAPRARSVSGTSAKIAGVSSKGPLSHAAPALPSPSCGRGIPRWSVGPHGPGSAVSMAGLPGSSGWVWVKPP